MTGTDNLRLVYTELCNSYRAIDQFRGVLLGALPLASGAGIYLSVKELHRHDPLLLMLLASFGLVISVGLFIFEIYGIRRCTHLIVLGEHLEERLKTNGQFRHRPRGVEKFPWVPARFSRFVNEPLAAGVIYPAVLGAWAVLAFATVKPWLGAILGVAVFLIGCRAMLAFSRWLEKDADELRDRLQRPASGRRGRFVSGPGDVSHHPRGER